MSIPTFQLAHYCSGWLFNRENYLSHRLIPELFTQEVSRRTEGANQKKTKTEIHLAATPGLRVRTPPRRTKKEHTLCGVDDPICLPLRAHFQIPKIHRRNPPLPTAINPIKSPSTPPKYPNRATNNPQSSVSKEGRKNPSAQSVVPMVMV